GICELQAHDVHVAPVRPADQPVGRGASVVLIHAGIAHEYVRPGEIDGDTRREPVLHAQRHPSPVVIGQPRRALRVAYGRLIVGEAAAEYPLVAVAIVSAYRS